MLDVIVRMGITYDDSQDNVDAALIRARARFAADFATGYERMAGLIEQVAHARDERSADDLAQALHRLGGLGGTIGFPRVSACARDLEDFVRDTPIARFDPAEARRRLDAVRSAFEEERRS
jgi:chemotaxis protein histidine kinase CheA